MNVGKIVQAFIRKGDFAHPGGIAAIELAMALFSKKNHRLILDVGCGLGGTAHYLQQENWGTVTGIDIDKTVLNYAKTRYPEITFEECDATKTHLFFKNKRFDIFCLFCSFFCIPQQAACLSSLSKIANFHSKLVLFDYSNFTDQSIQNPFTWSNNRPHFRPIQLSTIQKILTSQGWVLETYLDLSDHFQKWCQHFLDEMSLHRQLITAQHGILIFEEMQIGYQNLLDNLRQKKLGGIILYASPKAH